MGLVLRELVEEHNDSLEIGNKLGNY